MTMVGECIQQNKSLIIKVKQSNGSLYMNTGHGETCVFEGGSEYVMYRGVKTHRRGSGGRDHDIYSQLEA